MVFKALKDIAHITMGQSPESESYNDERVGIPFFQGNADFGEIYPNNRIWCSSPKKIAEPGDILISVRAPIGALNYAKERCCIGRGLAAISIKDEAERNYVFHLLKAKNKELNSKGTGSTFKAIGKNVLEEVLVPQISPKEQQKRMSIMDYLESIIRKRREQLLFLDKLIKARFVEMFGDPIDNFQKWPVKKLKDISSLITNGNTPKGGSSNYVNEGIIFIRSQNVWRNRIDLSDVVYIDESTHNGMSKSSVHHNDILITKTGRINTENSSLGRAALYQGDDNTANINGHVYLVRLKDCVNPQFVVTILTSEAYRKYIRKVCVGGIDKRQINLDQVENFPIIQPPLADQIMFASLLKQIDKSKVAVQKALDEAQLLFDSLMQEYFG